MNSELLQNIYPAMPLKLKNNVLLSGCKKVRKTCANIWHSASYMILPYGAQNLQKQKISN